MLVYSRVQRCCLSGSLSLILSVQVLNVCSKYQFVAEFIFINGNKVACGGVMLWNSITQLFREWGVVGEISLFSLALGVTTWFWGILPSSPASCWGSVFFVLVNVQLAAPLRVSRSAAFLPVNGCVEYISTLFTV